MAKAKKTKSIVTSDVVKNYEKTKVKTSDGVVRRSLDNGDEVAQKLRGKTLEELGAVAKKAGLEDRWKDWKKLNPGQARMALGNAMRGQARARAEKKKAA